MSESRLSSLPTISITSEGPHDVLWNRIPDEHALRVGRLIGAWSLVEFKLECLIWHLIGGDKRDLRRLTSRLDHRPKEETIDELLAVRKCPAKYAAAWETTKDLIGQLVPQRNLLAHGVWIPYPTGESGLMQTRKGGIVKDSNKNPMDVVIAQITTVTTAQLDSWIELACKAVGYEVDRNSSRPAKH
jgi:hypothetical protein